MKRHPSHKRAPRGQALVELVLASLVFVTILMFGIHFAEVGYLSVKVTEASHSALLDTTGHKLHAWPKGVGDASNSAATAAAEATARYRDFDSRTSTARGDGLAQVFTRVSGMNVSCSTSSGPTFGPGFMLIGAYSDAGGVSCRSEALVEPMGAYTLTRRFLDDNGSGGFFSQPHVLRPAPFRVCGVGRARGGACPGRLSMTLDDWGLSGDAESGICPFIPNFPLPCPTNTPFWTMAASVFALNGLGQGIAGSQMAQGVVGMMPLPFFYGGENAFWMSSAGEPLFIQPTAFTLTDGWAVWPTTPGAVPIGLSSGLAYSYAYAKRDDCFLGRKCN